jgi:hypothetical protein
MLHSASTTIAASRYSSRRSSARFEWVVEGANLPVVGGTAQRLLEPRQLRLVEPVRVEDEEANVLLRKRVVPLAAHVEGRVQEARLLVVVAERRVEPDAVLSSGPNGRSNFSARSDGSSWSPMMLSPVVITISKGNRARAPPFVQPRRTTVGRRCRNRR